MFGFGRKEEAASAVHDVSVDDTESNAPKKTWKETMMPVFACGSGLFSDGYINNVRTFSLLFRFPSPSVVSRQSRDATLTTKRK